MTQWELTTRIRRFSGYALWTESSIMITVSSPNVWVKRPYVDVWVSVVTLTMCQRVSSLLPIVVSQPRTSFNFPLCDLQDNRQERRRSLWRARWHRSSIIIDRCGNLCAPTVGSASFARFCSVTIYIDWFNYTTCYGHDWYDQQFKRHISVTKNKKVKKTAKQDQDLRECVPTLRSLHRRGYFWSSNAWVG